MSESAERLVLLGLGSNKNALANLRRCLGALEARFGKVKASTVYQSADVSACVQDAATACATPVFHNMVAAFHSAAEPAAIKRWSKAQERAQGRLPPSAGANTHPIDIDLLAVGELCGEFDSELGAIRLPHDDMLAHAFVLRPLAELVPQARHPGAGKTYAELWASARATASPRLTPICLPSAAPL
ncbi:2-amino-4-hydroxy-6-hydroxymethyldihydropteridine diphosphokinase [Halomonas piscis]|uniref:2-amino-4-hydroxy-6-hydroxymethyldihydropteridine pyrophosphokinase n=1 Tax=Halomonas piscis TaxID=3031727 RepID=A0ABY9Z184_9GAMM|nr:2-amino-4-hydroxy-6-hydroxymethyldihydropteridine diphosphokinase [Halomonas piscis]WNK20904.1 2-amino-4-hydroxy-6-hydroxymethyldihydropteridine diphosphokinase [Halomonas piscis]